MTRVSTLAELLGDVQTRAARQALDAADGFTRQLAADEFDSAVRTQALFAADRPLAERALGSPYYEGSPYSWMADQLAAHRGNASRAAQGRLARYSEVGLELRASTTTTFNGLVPPAFLLKEAGTASRPARQAADSLSQLPLTGAGMTVTITRPVSGNTVDVQTSQNTNVGTVDAVLADQTVTLATIEGMVDLSRQSVERGDGDAWSGRELSAAFNRRLGLQVVVGSGAAGQVLGLVNQPGLTAVTYTDASPTSLKVTSQIAGAAAQVAAATGANYSDIVVIMHPRRLAAILRDTPASKDGTAQVIAGLRVVTDPNIRTTLGAGTNEDEILTVDPAQVILVGGDDVAFRFEDIAGPATIRLAAWGYAQVLNRIPGALARVSGTGLVAPTF